jgi:hypothetical protein
MLSMFSAILASRRQIFLRCSLLACGVASVVFLTIPQNGFSFSLNGYRWPSGTQIEMHLGLSRPPVAFQDGSASWNASAADALAIWNQYVDMAKFVEAAPAGPSGGDGANSVFFSNTIYGQSFGSTTLAVTINYSNLGSGVFTETDVIFNNAIAWNSYRGPIQGSGATATYDFHRVALHEFGHVLGLDHPDQHGQNVVALMNSIITDLDHLADDDIAGGQFLYTARITSNLSPFSVQAGNSFVYQITANNDPSSFEASPLPPGLQIDSATGRISGIPTAGGTYDVTVTAHGTPKDASAIVRIVVVGPVIQSSLSATADIGQSFFYYIFASRPASSFGADGLPPGLTLNAGNGMVSGVPTVAGTFDVAVVAHTAVGDARATVRMVVLPPRITSFSPYTIDIGSSISYRVSATGQPTSFAASPLPEGLQFDSTTGMISGVPTVSGTYQIAVTAHTPYGDASGTLQMTVLPPRIMIPGLPSAAIGSTYKLQVSASGQPSSFSAAGLPAGLTIDPATGLISGVPELSGTYTVTIIAHTRFGDASTTVNFVVTPLPAFQNPIATIPVSVPSPGLMVADPQRPRIYVYVITTGVAIIDTNTFKVIKTVPISHPASDFALSADGSKLWIAYGPYDSSRALGSIDLNNLVALPDLPINVQTYRVREGVAGRLYVSDPVGSLVQVDGATGAAQPAFWKNKAMSYLEISPDRRTLYVGDSGSEPSGSSLSRFDVSTSTPAMLQQTTQFGVGGQGLTISHNGEFVTFTTVYKGTFEVAGSDLTKVYGSIPSPNAGGSGMASPMAFSRDDARAFEIHSYSSKLNVYDSATYKIVRAIDLNGQAYDARMVVDNTNSYLFLTGHGFGQVEVYSTGLTPPPSAPKSLLNISTRLRSQGGDNVLIGGFIITGQEAKKLVLRAIGPSLPLTGRLGDPALELYDSTNALIAQNDNWNAHRSEVLATGLAPADEHEAAITATLQPGRYTALVRGVNGASGVALVEAYDLTDSSNSKLANISTRGKVEAGDNVMIGGFILGGDQVTNVAVRAIGPSLTNFGITGELTDPMLEVYNGNGALLAQDDDWRMYQEQALIDSGLAPTDNRESAMLLWLQPGAYTAIVRGKDQSAGVGLVEVYNLEAK